MIFAPDYIKTNDSEILNEEHVMHYDGRGIKFSIDVVPERNRNHGDKDAYFKYTKDSINYTVGDTETRISFRQPSYVKHPTGKPHDNLNSNELKNLVKQLEKPSKKHPGYTNWQWALHLYNKTNDKANLETKDQTSKEVKDAIKSGDYIPLDYPIPDYTKL